MRVLIFIILFVLIYFGVRRIIRDWRERYQQLDKQKRERDLKERKRDDVVDLTPDKDGVFREKNQHNDKDSEK